MTTKPIPAGYKLDKDIDAEFCLSAEYGHWTVADLIEILSEHPQDARVWITSGKRFNRLHPLEFIHSSDGEVFL